MNNLDTSNRTFPDATSGSDCLAEPRAYSPVHSRNCAVKIGIVLFDRFNDFELSIIQNVLRIANEFAGAPTYEWRIFSIDAKPVVSAAGVRVLADGSFDECSGDIIVIPGAAALENTKSPPRCVLRRIVYSAPRVIAVSDAVHALCVCGIISSGPAPLSSQYEGVICERFQAIEPKRTLFVRNGRFVLCRGGLATLDMMISEVVEERDKRFGHHIASSFCLDRVRKGNEVYSSAFEQVGAAKSPHARRAIRIMEQNIEFPVTLDDISSQLGISNRQLQRVFRECFGRSPLSVYREIRLNRAQHLILRTEMSVTEVSLASGFVSHSHFSRSYRSHFGVRPSESKHAG